MAKITPKAQLSLIKKSIAASFLIGLGNYVLLKIGTPLGPFLFAFGLFSICSLNLALFTGKCGFIFEDKISLRTATTILIVNLLAGYLFGFIFSFADPTLTTTALEKVQTWQFSLGFFLQAFLCGIIMYLAVAISRKGSPLGIFFGVPLFILAGLQHCIANIITLGFAHTFSWTLLLAILGNLLGAIFIWWFSAEPAKTAKK